MAKIDSNSPFFIDSMERRWSKSNNEHYWHVDLVHLGDGEHYTTYVSDSNRNYKHWTAIIDNRSNGFVIQGMSVVRGRVLNADCAPEIVAQWTGNQQMRRMINQELGVQMLAVESYSTYDQLFGE